MQPQTQPGLAPASKLEVMAFALGIAIAFAALLFDAHLNYLQAQ